MPVEIKPKGLDTSDKAVRERYEDSFHQLYIIHKLRWNLNLIFADVGDTDEYIDANEMLSEAERNIWKYIFNGIDYESK